jgi:hypothetical protein
MQSWRRGVLGLAFGLALASAGCTSGESTSPPYVMTSSAPSSSPPPDAAYPTTSPAVTSPAGEVGVLDCGGTFQVRPSEIIFACGDGGDVVTDLTWTQWDAEKAVGAGTEGLHNCVPNCAEGTVEYRSVSVVLGSPHLLRDGTAAYFTRAVVSGVPGEDARVLPLTEETG